MFTRGGKNQDLTKLLDPKTVAVVGATAKEDRIGGIILKELTRSCCKLYPVNPKYQTLRSLPCYPSVRDIPDRIDLAVITIPAAGVPEVLEECGKNGIPFAIVIAGGFGETGEEGKRLQDALTEISRKYGIRILGPNTLGVFFPAHNLDTIFVKHGDKALAGGGGTAVISQSGSVGIEALGLASNIGFGLRAFVGLGNKCDLAEIDFLEHFSDDPGTQVLAFYLESVNEGRKFLTLCQSISGRKPIIGLKAGRTETGASAVSSHTGRLAGVDLVVEGAFRQNGILRVQDDQELTDTCRVLEKCPLPQGNRVAVLSPAGGYGVICADCIEASHPSVPLQMAKFLPETEEKIRSATLPFASCHNPVDITASASATMFGRAMEVMLEDPGVDILICLVFWSPPGIEDNLLDIVASQVHRSTKPVLVFTTYGPFTDRYLAEFWKRGVVGYSSIGRTVRAARYLVERTLQLRFLTEGSGATKSAAEFRRRLGVEAAEGTVSRVKRWIAQLQVPGQPDELESKNLLAQFGIPIPRGSRFFQEAPTVQAERRAQAPSLPLGLSFPIVVKVCSSQILHKTEAKGVQTGVGREELGSVLAEFQDRFPGASLLIEEQASFSPPELIVGGIADPQFGMALLAGAGGVFAEVYKDVTSRLCPVTPIEAQRMLGELRMYPLLGGYRGLPSDREGLVQFLVQFSELLYASEGLISQIDLNPVVYSKAGWIVLDAKVILKSG